MDVNTTETPVRPYVGFKSRLHSEISRKEKEQREKSQVDLEEKRHKFERAKNYSKNVKEMYMPNVLSN